MGNLPAWGTDDLPEPLPYSAKNLLKMIGPGAILLATSIGGGEWLIGPKAAVEHGMGLMWIATVGIILQVCFNLEAIRYTLYTGEPILSGIMRLKPGATFWSIFYVTLTIAQLGMPALAKTCAQVIFRALYGVVAKEGVPADEATILTITYCIIGGTVLLLMFGGTVERMLEWMSWGMITYIFVFLVFVNIFLVPLSHTAHTLAGFLQFGYPLVGMGFEVPQPVTSPGGFFQFGTWPSDMSILLLASLAATAGSGGIGNLAITNWVRDKGMGMGGKVGAIPSALGSKQITLSHVGKTFPTTAENLSRWRTWWKYVVVDQVWLWGIGCFLGMFLNVNLATALVPEGKKLDAMEMGVFQAEHMAEKFWWGLLILGLLNGFWILFSTHLGNVDILVRTVTDILWVSNGSIRESKKLSVGKLYYGLLFAFTLWGCIVVRMANAIDLFKALAAIAGAVLIPASFQILRINTTMLPPELRPSLWRRWMLIACALFYGFVTTMLVWDTVQKLLVTKTPS